MLRIPEQDPALESQQEDPANQEHSLDLVNIRPPGASLPVSTPSWKCRNAHLQSPVVQLVVTPVRSKNRHPQLSVEDHSLAARPLQLLLPILGELVDGVAHFLFGLGS